MNFNIKTKVKLFFSLSIIIISLSMAFVMYVGNDSKNNVVALEKSREVEKKISRLYDLSNKVQFDIVQVQQWLTDVSATRGLDGLDDGYKEAKKYANNFNTNSKELLSLSKKMSEYKLTEVIESVIEDFDPYYRAGKIMAKTYVDFGPAEGNKRMSAFDSRAEKLNYNMSKVLKISKRFLKQSESSANENTESLHINILRLSTILNILGILNIIILLLLARYIIFSVLNVLGCMTSNMVKLADGKTDVVIEGLKREDEMGDIARAVMFFKDSISKTRKLLELNRKERNKGGDNNDFILESLKDFQSSSSSILEGIKKSDDSMKSISSDLLSIVKDSNRDVDSSVRASDEASICVQSVSTAVEELAASVQEITRQVSTSSEIAGDAMGIAKNTNKEIESLEEKVSRIGNVVKLITDIAEQTNLLALNATIEAARAGDAGKGFAVVASEVKSLANQTAKATDEISAQIKEIQTSTQDSARSIHRVHEVIEKINEISMTISSSVEEQSAASAEIARNSENAVMKTREASSACTNAKTSLVRLEDSALSVERSSIELSNNNLEFTSSIGNFLGKIQNNRLKPSNDSSSGLDGSSDLSTCNSSSSFGVEIDNKKAFIKWDSSILVGSDFIDTEHKKLISIINKFYVAVNGSDYNQDISDLFDELVDYTVYHFGHEEDEMLKSNYPDKERHFAQHKQFVERLSDIYERYKGGDKSAGKEILGFLASWLISHIKVLDKKLSLHLSSH